MFAVTTPGSSPLKAPDLRPLANCRPRSYKFEGPCYCHVLYSFQAGYVCPPRGITPPPSPNNWACISSAQPDCQRVRNWEEGSSPGQGDMSIVTCRSFQGPDSEEETVIAADVLKVCLCLLCTLMCEELLGLYKPSQKLTHPARETRSAGSLRDWMMRWWVTGDRRSLQRAQCPQASSTLHPRQGISEIKWGMGKVLLLLLFF